MQTLHVGGAIQEQLGSRRGRHAEVIKSFLQGLPDIVTKYA